MRIKKNGKVVTLTESDINRIVKKVLSEQEEQGDVAKGADSKIHPLLKDYVDKDKRVSLIFILRDEIPSDKKPLGVSVWEYGTTKNRQSWDKYKQAWDKNKDKDALNNMWKMIRDNQVKVYAYNNGDGKIQGLQYITAGPGELKIVSV